MALAGSHSLHDVAASNPENAHYFFKEKKRLLRKKSSGEKKEVADGGVAMFG